VSSGLHTPPEHQFAVAQSESAAQLPLHAVGPQEYGAHACVCRPGQAPAPSQTPSSVAVPEVHEGARQEVGSAGYAQLDAWIPSQLPPQTVPSEAHATRLPWGAPLAGLHVPTFPATSQASHCPLQARSQQNPSTHAPLAHWSSPVHKLACAFFATHW
jgi:hypothetical protein